MNRKNGIVLVFLLVLMASAVVPIYAKSDDLMINVHAKAMEIDGDSVRNDIAVSGNIIVSGMEETINVELTIDLEKPDGEKTSQTLILDYEVGENGNTILKYEAIVKDFATIKGMYYVTITARARGLTASADFKWDPPGGGGGPPEY
jgi:hypothetical protein